MLFLEFYNDEACFSSKLSETLQTMDWIIFYSSKITRWDLWHNKHAKIYANLYILYNSSARF